MTPSKNLHFNIVKELQMTRVCTTRVGCCTVRLSDPLQTKNKCNSTVCIVCTVCKTITPYFSHLCFHTSLVHTHLEVGERKIGVYLWGYLWWDHSLFTQRWVHNPSIYTLFNRTPTPLLYFRKTHFMCTEKKKNTPFVNLIKTARVSLMIACVYRLQRLKCEPEMFSRSKFIQCIELLYEF